MLILYGKYFPQDSRYVRYNLSNSFCSRISIRVDVPSATRSRSEDSKSCHDDRGHILVCDVDGRIEGEPCSSRRCQTDLETNDRMWLFHSGVCTTQLWRYVAIVV